MSERPEPSLRAEYRVFYPLETRWADNDVYGHVNNVAYYSYFDTAVNRFLIEQGGLQPGVDTVVGFVVHSSANFFMPVSYPDTLEIGLRIIRLGKKSVTWEVGVFSEVQEPSCVTGVFTHTFVDRSTGRSALIPKQIRETIEKIIS